MEAHVLYGAPGHFTVAYSLSDTTDEIQIVVDWYNKTSTRLAEAMWMSFQPIVKQPDLWMMDVLGSPVRYSISPAHCVSERK